VADRGDAVLDVVPEGSVRVRNAVAVPHPDHAASAAAGAGVVLRVGNVLVGVGMRRRGEC
jgi:hypothetical protein